MKEDIHIKTAADLADADAPETISGARAREFVAKTMKKKKIIPFPVWGGALAVAASIALAVVLILPDDSDGMGSPYQLMEMESIHSETAQVDSTVVDTLDARITIETIKE
jgi:hypothetical protein